jgi:hypothetical protein
MDKPLKRNVLTLGCAAAALLLLGVWFALGGRMAADSRVSGAMRGGMNVPFSTIEQAEMGAWRCPGAILCRSAADWSAEMAALGDDCLSLGSPAPFVDWDRYMVFLVTLGEKNSSGYMVEVREVRDEGGELVVDVAVTEPLEGGRQQTITSPFHLVEIEQREAPLRVQYVGGGSTPARGTTWGRLKSKFGSGT